MYSNSGMVDLLWGAPRARVVQNDWSTSWMRGSRVGIRGESAARPPNPSRRVIEGSAVHRADHPIVRGARHGGESSHGRDTPSVEWRACRREGGPAVRRSATAP